MQEESRNQMGKIYKLSDPCPIILSGIYKFTFPNGKSYIGLSNNIKKRIWAHNEKDYKLGRVVGNAIHYYGPITEFEVLEEIEPQNRQKMSEREKYWIQYYHTFLGDPLCNGYNATEGGDGWVLHNGVKNGMAAFNQETLEEIFNLLFDHRNISMAKIAEIYNVSSNTIKNINSGKTYFQPNIKYPIRTKNESNKYLLAGSKNSLSKFNELEIKTIVNLIQNSTLSFAEIARQFNTHPATIGWINKGTRYYNPKLTYPLRSKEVIKKIRYTRK